MNITESTDIFQPFLICFLLYFLAIFLTLEKLYLVEIAKVSPPMHLLIITWKWI